MTTDPFLLYELSVTSPDHLAKFLYAVHGKAPRVLGEDFSGTAALSRGWIRYKKHLRAVAVDQDQATLDRVEGMARLKKVASDVRKVRDRADVIAATNFPICYWHTRRDLLKYLRHVRRRLNKRGVFVADLYGGPHALKTGRRTKTVPLPEGGALTYIWDQQSVDPLSGRVFNAIHFRVTGEKLIRNAFTYDWRLWSIAELREAILEAGFRSTEVHDRMGAAIDVYGNVYVKPVEEGELERDYVVYVVGRT
jgi:SAM-dependent methyltransferase